MKTASTLFQTLALTALLAAQVHGSLTMPGVRQALRIISGQPTQIFCSSAFHIATVGQTNAGVTAIEPCP